MNDLTGILYQSAREYISTDGWLYRASVSPFACLRESVGPARNGVQAERSEFIVRAWTPSAAGRIKTVAGEGRLHFVC
jgi:hypothetical protein